MKILFKKMHEDAIIPTYATSGSAGMDLYSIENAAVAPGRTMPVRTGISIAMDKDTWCGIFPRSGLALKHGITLANSVGVIDSDFRGEIVILLHNNSRKCFFVGKGDRIAQMLFQPIIHAEVEICDELPETERGAGGFGSTGMSHNR